MRRWRIGAVALALAAGAPSTVLAAPAVVTPRSTGWSVSTVTDGDTLSVTRPGRTLTVRLIGINAPEGGECLADVAEVTLRTLVQDGPLRLVRDSSSTDQYGRALRYVHDADGRDVGAILVRRGLAVARRYEPDTARAERYDRLQARAKEKRRGIWSPDACGAASGARIAISIRPIAAAGDPNDEWVQFTNVGSRTVDMAGWTIADESASNRYTFAALSLAPRETVTVFSGCGRDSRLRRHWCSRFAGIWNNDGDTVFLRDRAGSLVATRSY